MSGVHTSLWVFIKIHKHKIFALLTNIRSAHACMEKDILLFRDMCSYSESWTTAVF